METNKYDEKRKSFQINSQEPSATTVKSVVEETRETCNEIVENLIEAVSILWQYIN